MRTDTSLKLKPLLRILRRVSNFLTEPSPAVNDFAARRRVIMHSVFLIFIAPAFFIPQIVRALHYGILEPILYYTPAFLLLIGAYVLGRTKYYTIGAGLTIIVLSAIPFLGTAVAGNIDNLSLLQIFIWEVLPVFFAALLLPLPVVILVAIGISLSNLLFLIFFETVTFSMVFYPGMYVICLSVLIIIEAYIRNKDQQIIERQTRELSESQKKYKGIVENTNDVIMLADSKGEVTYVSPASKEMLGYDSPELVGSHSWIAHPDDRQRVNEAFRSALSGESGTNYEYRILSKSGAAKYVSHSWTPIYEEGEVVTVVSVIRDISPLKKIEEDLLKSRKLESLGVLAGGIAHDFNNILTSILGNIALARLDIDSKEELEQALSSAEKATARAKDLTTQLLTFSKGGAPVKEQASIGELIKETSKFALLGSNVKYELSIPDDLWLTEVDTGQICQVISNLLLNAIQAMPDGGTVKINAANTHVNSEQVLPVENGGYVKFSIQDLGIGIDRENLSKIFDPYFTTKSAGSGLGLAISHAIVENHGGYIRVESEKGIGSTFSVYLSAIEHEDQTETPKDQDAVAAGGSGRILILDDHSTIREVMGKLLGHVGYEVTLASNGAEAVDLYLNAKESETPFDAAILDLTVRGGIGGKEIVDGLLNVDPDIKAIASTGYSNDPVMSDYKQFGFSGAIAKPFTIEKLATVLHRVIREQK